MSPNGPPKEVESRTQHRGRLSTDSQIASVHADKPTAFDFSSSRASEQVSWWDVHEFLEAIVAQANVGPLPRAGSPAWCELADGDPRKLLAVAIDGEHHVLRVEVAQAARAEASRAVSASADWPAVAREIQQRKDLYASKPWLRRSDS